MNNLGGKCTQSLTHGAHETLLDHNLLEVGGAVGEMRYLKICLQTLPLFNYQFLLTSSFAFHLFFRLFPTSSRWPRAWHRLPPLQICQMLSYLLSFLSLLDAYTRIDSMFLPLIYNTAFIYFNSYDATALHNFIWGHVEGTNGAKLRSTNLIKVMTGSVKVFCFSLRQGFY